MTRALMAQMLVLAAEGRLQFREPIIGEPKPMPYNERYDIEARDKAEAKRLRKARRKADQS